jgi:hypothetical protein
MTQATLWATWLDAGVTEGLTGPVVGEWTRQDTDETVRIAVRCRWCLLGLVLSALMLGGGLYLGLREAEPGATAQVFAALGVICGLFGGLITGGHLWSGERTPVKLVATKV